MKKSFSRFLQFLILKNNQIKSSVFFELLNELKVILIDPSWTNAESEVYNFLAL